MPGNPSHWHMTQLFGITKQIKKAFFRWMWMQAGVWPRGSEPFSCCPDRPWGDFIHLTFAFWPGQTLTRSPPSFPGASAAFQLLTSLLSGPRNLVDATIRQGRPLSREGMYHSRVLVFVKVQPYSLKCKFGASCRAPIIIHTV